MTTSLSNRSTAPSEDRPSEAMLPWTLLAIQLTARYSQLRDLFTYRYDDKSLGNDTESSNTSPPSFDKLHINFICSYDDLTKSYRIAVRITLGRSIRSFEAPLRRRQELRFSTKPQDGMTGLYYYGYRWYDAGSGRWLSRDPIGEFAGENLYAMVGNEPIGNLDILGGEPIKRFSGRGLTGLRSRQTSNDASNGLRSNPLLILRQIFGILGTISSGDVLRGGGEVNFSDTGTAKCQFLISVSGVVNDINANRAFPRELRDNIFAFKQIENTAFVNNPTAYLLDSLQILTNEAYGITKPDRELARFVTQAYKTALKNDCSIDCIVINVVGHSQGAAIVKSGLALVNKKIKTRVRVVTIGAQNTVPKSGLLGAINIIGDDPIPKISPHNKIKQKNTNILTEDAIQGHGRVNYLNWLKDNPKVIPLIK